MKTRWGGLQIEKLYLFFQRPGCLDNGRVDNVDLGSVDGVGVNTFSIL